MKKVFLIMLLAGLLLLNGCKARHSDVLTDYCYMLNEKLIGADFDKAYVADGVISLYDSGDTLLMEIDFDAYDESKKVLYIRKENQRVYFILGGSVDDEYGIMFVNDESNELLDGIHTIERVGGNAYEYSTS